MGLPRSVEDSTYEKSKNKKKKKEREKKEERYPRRSWQSLGIAVRRRPTTPQKRLPLSLIRLPTLPPSFFSPLFFFLLYDRPVRSFRENSSPRASPTTYTRFPPGRRLNGRTCYHLASFRRAPREFLPFDVPSQAGGDRISARRARFPFRQTGNPLLRPGSGGCPFLTSMNTGIVIVRKVKFSFFTVPIDMRSLARCLTRFSRFHIVIKLLLLFFGKKKQIYRYISRREIFRSCTCNVTLAFKFCYNVFGIT